MNALEFSLCSDIWCTVYWLILLLLIELCVVSAMRRRRHVAPENMYVTNVSKYSTRVYTASWFWEFLSVVYMCWMTEVIAWEDCLLSDMVEAIDGDICGWMMNTDLVLSVFGDFVSNEIWSEFQEMWLSEGILGKTKIPLKETEIIDCRLKLKRNWTRVLDDFWKISITRCYPRWKLPINELSFRYCIWTVSDELSSLSLALSVSALTQRAFLDSSLCHYIFL